MKNLTIIGGGAAALVLAAELDPEKYRVTLVEQKKTVGRKFLVAGEGGLNLTYHSSPEELRSHYFPREFLEPILRQFTNADLVAWLADLGVTTFAGSSNRVFPEQGRKPIEILNALTDRLSDRGVAFQLDTTWTGWDDDGQPTFAGYDPPASDVVVFSLGGASWSVTGSDGAWRPIFERRGVRVFPFRAANCAFRVAWDKQFLATHAGKPLKNISLRYGDRLATGELVISAFGLEGNALYALSRHLQDDLLNQKSVVVHLDLKPMLTVGQLTAKYRASRLRKVTDILREDLRLDRTAIGLLKQQTSRDTFLDPALLVAAIKAVPIVLHAADELDRAISSLGGIALEEVDAHCQLRKIPGSYAIGEMLDWYAPTGGYLLQGCFSMGFALAKHLNRIAE